MVTTTTSRFDTGKIFLTLIVVIVALFLIGNFVGVTEGVFEFKLPSDIEPQVFTAFKLIFMGVIAYAAFVLVGKLSKGAPTKEDLVKTIIMIAVIGAAAYFMYDSIIAPFLNAGSFDEIVFSVAKKVGLL